jgi:hypothetical protein
MVKTYPNNACCYYVSWDNVPLTAGLLVAENLVFVLIWAFELETVTLITSLLIFSLLWKLVQKSFKLNPGKSCCSSCDSETCIKKTFEQVYNKINDSLNFFRNFGHGLKAVLLVLVLLFVRWVNPCVLCVAWVVAMWSFVQPALIKFAGLDLAAVSDLLIHENPLEDIIGAYWEMIPRSSSVRKSE